MSPILGIIASSFAASTTSYESISTVTVGSGGSSGSITFSSIPQTYKHLQIRILARGTDANVDGNCNVQLNGDSGSNYSRHRLIGNGSSASSDGGASESVIRGVGIPSANALASAFGGGVIDLLDYTNANKYTTSRSLSGYDLNGGGAVFLQSGVWLNSAAVTSITLLNGGGGANFAQYSQFALYGIRG